MIKAPFTCKYCGAPSFVDPSDQRQPPDYCHPEDHGSDDDRLEYAAARIEDLEGTVKLLRTALVGLVDADGEELHGMLSVMRLMPVPENDKAAMIAAMQALITTLPEK